ncbi:hypothetical protein GALMADRAFT_215185 [Galerina marginata CBS 339.88]|uniref:F-box domain-containing protein n=1 Tax=Galerina marginata (strain CBS 339.88) TaxID=685588 RepID=A0A067SF63_GALM3|nr:hypothetical protein GALMADRAFT_215185 [Galerina marginata CBS 339.88]
MPIKLNFRRVLAAWRLSAFQTAMACAPGNPDTFLLPVEHSRSFAASCIKSWKAIWTRRRLLIFSALLPVPTRNTIWDGWSSPLACRQCSVLHWKDKILSKAFVRNPKFGTCCLKVECSYRRLRTPPGPLRALFPSQDRLAVDFYEDIWMYNCAFTFTSLGILEEHSVSRDRGPPVSGELNHCLLTNGPTGIKLLRDWRLLPASLSLPPLPPKRRGLQSRHAALASMLEDGTHLADTPQGIGLVLQPSNMWRRSKAAGSQGLADTPQGIGMILCSLPVYTKRLVIVDSESRVIGVGVGASQNDHTWDSVRAASAQAPEAARSQLQLEKDDADHRRGLFPAMKGFYLSYYDGAYSEVAPRLYSYQHGKLSKLTDEGARQRAATPRGRTSATKFSQHAVGCDASSAGRLFSWNDNKFKTIDFKKTINRAEWAAIKFNE